MLPARSFAKMLRKCEKGTIRDALLCLMVCIAGMPSLPVTIVQVAVTFVQAAVLGFACSTIFSEGTVW